MSKTDINSFLDGDETQGSNDEASAIKSQLMSIVASMEVMDEEKENIKECKNVLKDNHGIPPKVANAVAKIMRDPSVLQEMEDTELAIQQLYSKVSK